VIETLLGIEQVSLPIVGRMLALRVVVMELNHVHGKAGRAIRGALNFEMGENCTLALWWILIGSLNMSNAGLVCTPGHWGLFQAKGGRLDAHLLVAVLMCSSLDRGLVQLDWHPENYIATG
jgi:hypothetical protein